MARDKEMLKKMAKDLELDEKRYGSPHKASEMALDLLAGIELILDESLPEIEKMAGEFMYPAIRVAIFHEIGAFTHERKYK